MAGAMRKMAVYLGLVEDDMATTTTSEARPRTREAAPRRARIRRSAHSPDDASARPARRPPGGRRPTPVRRPAPADRRRGDAADHLPDQHDPSAHLQRCPSHR